MINHTTKLHWQRTRPSPTCRLLLSQYIPKLPKAPRWPSGLFTRIPSNSRQWSRWHITTQVTPYHTPMTHTLHTHTHKCQCHINLTTLIHKHLTHHTQIHKTTCLRHNTNYKSNYTVSQNYTYTYTYLTFYSYELYNTPLPHL